MNIARFEIQSQAGPISVLFVVAVLPPSPVLQGASGFMDRAPRVSKLASVCRSHHAVKALLWDSKGGAGNLL